MEFSLTPTRNETQAPCFQMIHKGHLAWPLFTEKEVRPGANMRKAWATSHCRLQPHTVLGVRLEYSQGVPLPFNVNLETRCDWAWQRPETSGGRGIRAWGGVSLPLPYSSPRGFLRKQ